MAVTDSAGNTVPSKLPSEVSDAAWAAVKQHVLPFVDATAGASPVIADNSADDTARLQALVDSFNNLPGVIVLPPKTIYCAGSVDFKRVGFVGQGALLSGIRFGTDKGLYSSLPENFSPPMRDITLTGSAEKTANGQVLLDMTGKNYPLVENIRFFNAGTGLLIAPSATVETHYGVIYASHFNRCHVGLAINGEAGRGQSHTIHGGRFWDCVTGYENRNGAADINFYGTQFESVTPYRHVNSGSNPEQAETRFHGARDESTNFADVQCGSVYYIGTYQSSPKVPRTDTYTGNAVADIGNKVVVVAGNDYSQRRIPINLLRNAQFEPSGATIPNWFTYGGDPVVVRTSHGPVLQMNRPSATPGTVGAWQTGIAVKAGAVYRWGVERRGDNASTFTAALTDNGTALVSGVDFDLGSAVYASGGNDVHREIRFLRDIPNLRFAMQVAGASTPHWIYFCAPYIVEGRHVDMHLDTQTMPGDIEIANGGMVLRSPDGTRYRLTVANGGTVSVSPA